MEDVIASIPLMGTRLIPLKRGLDTPAIPLLSYINKCTFMHPEVRGIAHSTLKYYWEALPGKIGVVLPDREVPLELVRQTWAISEYMRRMTLRRPEDHPAIVILLLDLPKLWRGVASSRDINSGTYFHDHVVLIWRIEEYYKVLIHELVHAYRWDQIPVENIPRKLIPLAPESRFAPRESITETITILFSCFLHDKDLLRDQIRWSTYQAAFLWHNLPRDHEGRIIQETDVVSYYIHKAFWLWSLHPGKRGSDVLRKMFLQNTVLGREYYGHVISWSSLDFKPPTKASGGEVFSLRMSYPKLFDGP